MPHKLGNQALEAALTIPKLVLFLASPNNLEQVWQVS